MLRRKRFWLILLLVAIDQLLHTLWGYAEALKVNPRPDRWFSLLPGVSSYILACIGLLLLVSYLPPTSKRAKLGFSLAFAGSISNLITELRYGQVVDYVIVANWVVNLADGMVVAGLALLIFSQLKLGLRKGKSRR